MVLISRTQKSKRQFLAKGLTKRLQLTKQTKTVLLVLGFFLSITVFITGIFQIPNLLIISRVDCKSQYGVCSDQIFNETSYLGKSYQTIRKDLGGNLPSNPLVESYRTTFKFPNSLLLEIVEKKPIFALKLINNKLYAQIYQDGQVVKIVEENALPHIEVGMLPKQNSHVSDEILFALRLVAEVSKSYDVVSSKIVDEALVLEIENYQVIFPTTGDIEVLLGSFYTIYNQLNNAELGLIIGDRNLSLIDLRFENPVLKPR